MNTPSIVERLVEEANYLFSSLVQGLEKVGDNGVPYVSDKTGLDWLRSALSQARQEGREETIKYCKKEMYKALDEVAQYGHKEPITLVNKADIKVWINALTTEGK